MKWLPFEVVPMERQVTVTEVYHKYRYGDKVFDTRPECVAYAVKDSTVKAFTKDVHHNLIETQYWEDACLLYIPNEEELELVKTILPGYARSFTKPGWWFLRNGWMYDEFDRSVAWIELTPDMVNQVKNPNYFSCSSADIENIRSIPDGLIK